jgi:hypothetical protein
LPVATAAEALLYDFVAEAIQSVSPCLYKRDTAEIKGTRYPEGKVITVSDSKVIGFPIPIERKVSLKIRGHQTPSMTPKIIDPSITEKKLYKIFPPYENYLFLVAIISKILSLTLLL